jgi:hypothetical protein
LPVRSFVVATFSVLLNGIEALGSFIAPPTSGRDQNRANFFTFIRTYMKSWDKTVRDSPYEEKDLKKILWLHFRNGIAHGFYINGGIDNEADTAPGGWRVVTTTSHPSGCKIKRLEIGPNTFFRDFRVGVDRFFDDIAVGGDVRTIFLTRFRKLYLG